MKYLDVVKRVLEALEKLLQRAEFEIKLLQGSLLKAQHRVQRIRDLLGITISLKERKTRTLKKEF